MGNLCNEIHDLLNTLPRFSYPFNYEKFPNNGLLVLFEKGETSHGKDRIVMVGSHTRNNRLRSRLEEHFVIENKDRSILRKNIGRCILNKRHDPYLSIWEICMIPINNRDEYGHLVNEEYQLSIEKEVSKFMQENFSFCVIRVDNKDVRKKLKLGLVATISSCEDCRLSSNWFGLNSPKKLIRNSGMWQEQGLYGQPITIEELEYIKKLYNYNE